MVAFGGSFLPASTAQCASLAAGVRRRRRFMSKRRTSAHVRLSESIAAPSSAGTSPSVIAIGIATALNALDGFDVLSISFAAPGIARDWGIDRAALGLVLSMELIGMGIGALILGAMADRIGRRPTILFPGCHVVAPVSIMGSA